MLVAQSAMANLLLPPVRSLGPLKAPEMVKAYGFETDGRTPPLGGAGRTVIVAWVEEGAELKEISLTRKPWQAVDLQGNELKVDSVSLSERPIYFVAKGTSPALRKGGTRLRELPW